MKALQIQGMNLTSLTSFSLEPHSRLGQEQCPSDPLHDLNVNRAGQYVPLNHILLCPAITCWVSWLNFVNLWNILQIVLFKYLSLYTHRGMCYFPLCEFPQIRKNACSKQGQQSLCRKTTLGVATKHTQECWETSAAPLWNSAKHLLLLPTLIFTFSSSPGLT